MGSYNLTCAVSNLPIKTDDVTYFILLKETFSKNHCYSNEFYTPVSLPLLCTYCEEEGLIFDVPEEESNAIEMINNGMSQYKNHLSSFREIKNLNELIHSPNDFVYYDPHCKQGYNNTKTEKNITYMVVHKSIFEKMSSHESYYQKGSIKKEQNTIKNLQKLFFEIMCFTIEASTLARENPNKHSDNDFKSIKTWREHFSKLRFSNFERLDPDNTLASNFIDNTLTDSQIGFLLFPLENYFENMYDISPDFNDIYLLSPKFKFNRFKALEHTMNPYGSIHFIKNACFSNNETYINKYLSMGRFDKAMEDLAKQYLPQITNFEENYDTDLFNIITNEALAICNKTS